MILGNKVATASFDQLAAGGIRIIYNQPQHAILSDHRSIPQEDIKFLCNSSRRLFPQHPLLSERKFGKDYGEYYMMEQYYQSYFITGIISE